ncbi:hypothetical protein ACG0Z6_06570 [Roseateles sp. BYS180W]|uniref:ABC transporter permease n=1 Tax=Roseateles rivi TaxID=3299028 RepID=A0ABW7FUA8_9BURK
MTRLLNHALNETRRSWWLARRYWVETLVSLGFLLSLFAGLLLAVLKTSGQSLDSGHADGLIAGFALWLFASSAALSSAHDIREETEQGSLEQLSLTPLGLGGLLGVRLGLKLLQGLGLLLLCLLAIGWLTAGRVQASPTMLGLALLGSPALVGLGFALAGLGLLVKRSELLLVAIYPALIALVSLPALPLNALAVLPYALAAAAARASATGTMAPAEVWAWVGLNSVLYLGLGLAVFRRCLQQARRLGVLGHR